jgi:hypothetical protein
MIVQVTYIVSQTGLENTHVVWRTNSLLFVREVNFESAQRPTLDLSNYILDPTRPTSGLCDDGQNLTFDCLRLTRIEFRPFNLRRELRYANGPVIELSDPSLQSGS